VPVCRDAPSEVALLSVIQLRVVDGR